MIAVVSLLVVFFLYFAGLLAFWRSNLIHVLGFFPAQTLTFATKPAFNSLFKVSNSDSRSVQFCKHIAAGSVAGITSLSLLYSLDYTRNRLAADVIEGTKGGERQFRGILDVYRKSLKSDGLVGLYRGFVVSCFGIAVYRGCFFGLYDTMKLIFLKDASYLHHMCLGYVVTVTAGLIAYPFDTVHRRMLMRTAEAVKYKGSWDCFTQVVKNEGYLSLMNGAGVNIVRGFAGAFILGCYEKLKNYYNVKSS